MQSPCYAQIAMSLVFAFALALQTAQVCFEPNMLGLYRDDGGVIVVTSGDRAHVFSGDKYFQFRDIAQAPDGVFQGYAVERAKLTDATEGAMDKKGARAIAPNALTVDAFWTDAPGANGYKADGYIRVNPYARGGHGVIEGFKWSLIDGVVGNVRSTGSARRCGNLEDISMAGTYSYGKSMTVKIVWVRTSKTAATISGSLTWDGHTYDLSGDVGFTHANYKLTNHTTGFAAGRGTIEWAPTPESMPDWGDPVKPANRLYMQWPPATLGKENALSFFLTRTGD